MEVPPEFLQRIRRRRSLPDPPPKGAKGDEGVQADEEKNMNPTLTKVSIVNSHMETSYRDGHCFLVLLRIYRNKYPGT